MKQFKRYFGIITILALLFTSCSKDEQSGVIANDNQKATLSFATILNDMMNKRAATKQSAQDLPMCSDAAPAYVKVILSQGGNQVVGTTADPLKVNVNPTPADYDNDGIAEYFTNESASLELAPGTYTLDYFKVYDANDNIIWIAPRTGGGTLANYVDNPLPFDINLGAGVKKYVDVDVLCYDHRMVNLYGYLFFDIEETQVINFCIFGNYCDANGRHFPAHFSVSVWRYVNNAIGDPLVTDLQNTVSLDANGDYAGTTVCVDLPDGNGVDQYYFEITLLNSDAYGTVDNSIIRSGVITDQQVRDLFTSDTNTDYYHFREGNCNLPDSPVLFDGGATPCDLNDANADCDGDGILNGVDQCSNTPKLPGQIADPTKLGCWIDPTGGDCVYEDVCDIPTVDFPCLTLYANGDENLFLTTGSNNTSWTFEAASIVSGSATVSYDGNHHLVITIVPETGFSLSGYVIEVIPALPGGGMSTTCREFACDASAGDTAAETFTTVSEGDSFYVNIKAIICPPVIPG